MEIVTESKDLLYFPYKQFSSRFGDAFFTYNMQSFKLVTSDSLCFVANYIAFVFTMYRGKSTWVIQRRFSEFVTLISYLKNTYSSIEDLPTIPPKTCLRMTTDEVFLKERLSQLDTFIDDLLRVLSQRKLIGDLKVLSFFGLNFQETQQEGPL